MSRQAHPSLLSRAEAERALYLDFEGGQKLPPSFVGIRVRTDQGEVFEQIVLEDGLFGILDLPAARSHKWPDGYQRVELLPATAIIPAPRADTFSSMASALVGRAITEDRLIVSWSTHERDQILNSLAIADDVKRAFGIRWRDAKNTAKHWKRRVHPGVAFARLPGRGRNRLDSYMRLIGYRLPAYFGDRQAAARIAAVRDQLTRRTPENLTSVVKGKWTNVLDYNWHDCNGMREVALAASA